MLLFALLLLFIAIAIGLAWFLIGHDRGQREPIAALWMAVGFGIAASLAAALLESWLIPLENLAIGTPAHTLVLATLAVGLIEETCKFVPLALVIYKQPFFNEHTDGIIYFALAGLGFGVPENILYTVQFGAKTGLVRALVTPFFHAATTGVLGYFLIKRKLSRRSPLAVILPFTAIVLLHSLYDFGLLSGGAKEKIGSLLLALAISAALFTFFLRANQRDQDRGLSAVGHNGFCRSCGFPNPAHHLYCTHCGKNA